MVIARLPSCGLAHSRGGDARGQAAPGQACALRPIACGRSGSLLRSEAWETPQSCHFPGVGCRHRPCRGPARRQTLPRRTAMTIRASHTVFFPSGTANLLHFFGGIEMKNAFVLLIGIALVGPALAQQPPSPPAPSSAEAGNGSVRYAPNAERLADGQYRAEVRRNNGAPGADEIAWSSAPHASAPEAIKEACKMIEMVYVPGTRCPAAAVASKKAIQRPAQAKAATKPAPATAVKKVGVISQVSG